MQTVQCSVNYLTFIKAIDYFKSSFIFNRIKIYFLFMKKEWTKKQNSKINEKKKRDANCSFGNIVL